MANVWQGTLGNFDNALKIVNDLYWNITFHLKNNKWQLFTSDQSITKFEIRAKMESFVIGMALALGVLPPEIIGYTQKII